LTSKVTQVKKNSLSGTDCRRVMTLVLQSWTGCQRVMTLVLQSMTGCQRVMTGSTVNEWLSEESWLWFYSQWLVVRESWLWFYNQWLVVRSYLL